MGNTFVNDVGDSLGTEVRFPIGVVVLVVVALNDGMTDRPEDGWMLVPVVGCSVGLFVRTVVGIVDGEKLGILVGWDVGKTEVNQLVGSEDGCKVEWQSGKPKDSWLAFSLVELKGNSRTSSKSKG